MRNASSPSIAPLLPRDPIVPVRQAIEKIAPVNSLTAMKGRGVVDDREIRPDPAEFFSERRGGAGGFDSEAAAAKV